MASRDNSVPSVGSHQDLSQSFTTLRSTHFDPQGIPNGLPSRFKHPGILQNAGFAPVMKSASFSSFGNLSTKNSSDSTLTQSREQIQPHDIDSKTKTNYPERNNQHLKQGLTRSQENLAKDLELSPGRHEIILRSKDAQSLFESDSLKFQTKRPKSSGDLLSASTGDLITSSLQKYEDINDEPRLQTMLQECTELEERIQIRAALRKLKQRQLNEKAGSSGPLHVPNDTTQQSTGYSTTLQQNKQHLQDLFNHTGSYHQDNSSSADSIHNASGGSDALAVYGHLTDQSELQNLLNQTEDYFERKKIRTALTALKRRNSIAEIENQKRRNSQRQSSHSDEEDDYNHHSNHIDSQPTPQHSKLATETRDGASLNSSTLSDDVFRTTQESKPGPAESNRLSGDAVNVQEGTKVDSRSQNPAAFKSHKHSGNILQPTEVNLTSSLHNDPTTIDSDQHPVVDPGHTTVTNGDCQSSEINRLINTNISHDTCAKQTAAKSIADVTEQPCINNEHLNKQANSNKAQITNSETSQPAIDSVSLKLNVKAPLDQFQTADSQTKTSFSYKGEAIVNHIPDNVTNEQIKVSDVSDTTEAEVEYEQVLLRKQPGRRVPKSPNRTINNKAYSTTDVIDINNIHSTMDYQQSMIIPPHVDINSNSKSHIPVLVGTDKKSVTSDVVKSQDIRNANDEVHPKSVEGSVDNRDSTTEQKQELLTLSEMNTAVKQLQKELENSSDFDERRCIRRQIRDARTAIKDGQYRRDSQASKTQSVSKPVTKSTNASNNKLEPNDQTNEEPIIISPVEVKVHETVLHLNTVEETQTIIQETKSKNTTSNSRALKDKTDFRKKCESSESVKSAFDQNDDPKATSTESKTDSAYHSKLSKFDSDSHSKSEADHRSKKVEKSAARKFKTDSALVHDLSVIKPADDISCDLIGSEIDDAFVVIEKSDVDGSITSHVGNVLENDKVSTEHEKGNGDKLSKFTGSEEPKKIADDLAEPATQECRSDQAAPDLIVTQPLSDCIAFDGEAISFKCRISKCPCAQITWFKGSREIAPSAEFRTSFDGERVELAISQIFPDDEGEYSCHVSHAATKLTTKCYLLVKENKAAVLPKFSRGLQDTRVCAGNKLVLSCEVISVPAPRIYWYYSSIMIKKSNPELKQAYDGQIATLTIDQAVAEDSGEYTCAAKNTAGEVRCSCILDVTDKDSEKETEESSSNKTLQNGNSKNEDVSEIVQQEVVKPEVMEQPEIELIDVEDEQEAEEEGPEVTMQIDEMNMNQGDTVSLTCHVTGKPTPTVMWKRDDLELVPSKEMRQEYENGVATLTVTSLEVGHEGVYECAAQNSGGSAGATASVTVKAKPKPKVIQNSEPIEIPKITKPLNDVTEISLDTYFCLQCHFLSHSNKTQVAWFKDDIELPKVGRMKWSYERAYTKLWIHHASRGDVGTYKVVINNTAGQACCYTSVKLTENITPVRKKLQPKQVDEKASNLLSNVLDNIMQSDSGPQKVKKIFSQYKTDKTTSSQEKKQNKPIIMTDKDVDKVDDEELLYKMLNQTENFDDRKKIRARLRHIREQKTAEYEKQRKEREAQREDAVKMKQRQAQEEKERKLKEYQELAKSTRKHGSDTDPVKERQRKAEEEKQRKLQQYNELAKTSSNAYQAGSDLTARLDQEKAQEVKDKEKARMSATTNEDAVSKSTKTETGPSGTTTTSVTTTTHKTQDGGTMVTKQTKQVTQVSKVGGTSYSISKTSAAKSGPRGAMAAFKQMDTDNPKPNPMKFLPLQNIRRNASTVKQHILNFCILRTRDYENVDVTNFSSSWNDGMAFCALIHHYHPEAFDFKKLDPKKRRANFALAFHCAEKYADIAPLLDVDDMVRMKNPDWKCVFTYVQSFYRRFNSPPYKIKE